MDPALLGLSDLDLAFVQDGGRGLLKSGQSLGVGGPSLGLFALRSCVTEQGNPRLLCGPRTMRTLRSVTARVPQPSFRN